MSLLARYRQLNPEQEMIVNRLAMGIPAGIMSFAFSLDPMISACFVVYLACGMALLVMERMSIWHQPERFTAAIILDAMTGFSVMLREPEIMAWTYPVFLWVILGNGFRFGIKWLFVAATTLAITFGIIVASTSYWQHNPILGWSLTGALLIIPAYCSTLIRKISTAKEEAEGASRAKSYFLASVSHELRTPLNAIIGYGNHLRQLEMPRNQKEMIEASVLAGEHLLHLIEQLIQVAKTGTGNAVIKNSTFKPTDLLTEIRDIMAVRAEDKGLALRIQAEPLSDASLEGPSEIIRNILLNLTGNAIKFTESGSVSITGGLEEIGKKQHVWFAVGDTGIGIARNAMERIFQPFQQADDSVMNRFGGTGLGLAICKQLAEDTGGSISVRSDIGLGSVFRISIPVKPVAASAEAEQSADMVRVVSLGHFAPELLATAQSAGNFAVKHIAVDTPQSLIAALADIRLDDFDVAMIEQRLAAGFDGDHDVWKLFSAADVAPVLVASDSHVDFEDIALRAAFASVVSASPDFAELRSAIRIGHSFARQMKLPGVEEQAAAPIKVTPRSVLVADDNRTNRNVLAAILEAAGHKVSMVTDGDEALDALEQGGIDILLLDVNMPRLNGIDACSMWRQIEGGRSHIPIVGVTADATAETEQRCINAGMDMRLTKPVNSNQLLATIERFCKASDVAIPDTASDPLSTVVPIGGSAAVSPSIDQAQLSYLWSIGDARFVASMVDGFFEDVAETIGPMRDAATTLDVHQFRFCAHALKSAANNMGAAKLAAICAKIEKISEGEFAKRSRYYMDKVEAELASVETELRSPAFLQRPAAA